MTRADKEYIEMAATLTAQKVMNEMKKELHCTENMKAITEMVPKIDQNTKGVKSNRKFLFFGIGLKG